MATLDKINADKKGKKKVNTGNNDMSSAVAKTEKIRDWVSFMHAECNVFSYRLNT